MGGDRFEHIRKMLHFVDPFGTEHDKLLCTLKTFLKIICTKLRTVYTQNNTSIDEYLTRFKGNLKFKAYIASKQERFVLLNMLGC